MGTGEDGTVERDIMTVEQAAESCGVTAAVILDWIDSRGLKATPIGSVARRGPRRYLIRRQWLLDNLEAWAVTGKPGRVEVGTEVKSPAKLPRPARDGKAGPLGARPGR